MIVNASTECKCRYRNKAVKRHSGLHLFQVLCESSGCCSPTRTAPAFPERDTHPLMMKIEGITLSCQPIKLIFKGTALKRHSKIKLWYEVSPVSLHIGNLHKHWDIQPSKIRTDFFFFNWGGGTRGRALSSTMGNPITCRWKIVSIVLPQ